jgi:hypothetical protein
MKNTIRDLAKQLDGLEKKLLYPARDRRLCWNVCLDEKERAGLREGQRIVADQHEDAKGYLTMTMERITAEKSDIGKCFPLKYWSREALQKFRELEEYARHNTIEVESVSWEERLPLVGGKDGRLLEPTDQPSRVQNDEDPDDDRSEWHDEDPDDD